MAFGDNMRRALVSIDQGLPGTSNAVWLASKLDSANDSVTALRTYSQTTYDATHVDTDFNVGSAKAASDYDIRDTADHRFYFNHGLGGWTETQIDLSSSLDQACTIYLYVLRPVLNSVTNAIYWEASVLIATTGHLTLSPYAAGVGAGGWKAIPALAGPLPRYCIDVKAAVQPTSGTLTIQISRRA